MIDFLKILAKVLPPIVAVISTVISAIGDLDSVSSSDEKYSQEPSDWGL